MYAFSNGSSGSFGPVAGGSEPPGTALAVPGVTPPISSPKCRKVPNPVALGTRKWGLPLALRVLMHKNLQCQGVRNPLALRLKIGLTCCLFWGVCAIKPQAERLVVCCLVCSCVLSARQAASRFASQPAFLQLLLQLTCCVAAESP